MHTHQRLATSVALAAILLPINPLAMHGQEPLQIVNVVHAEIRQDPRVLLTALNQLIQEDQQNAKLFLRRGDVYTRLEDLEHACADYDHAVQLSPNDAQALINQEVTHRELVRRQKARSDMELKQLGQLAPTESATEKTTSSKSSPTNAASTQSQKGLPAKNPTPKALLKPVTLDDFVKNANWYDVVIED